MERRYGYDTPDITTHIYKGGPGQEKLVRVEETESVFTDRFLFFHSRHPRPPRQPRKGGSRRVRRCARVCSGRSHRPARACPPTPPTRRTHGPRTTSPLSAECRAAGCRAAGASALLHRALLRLGALAHKAEAVSDPPLASPSTFAATPASTRRRRLSAPRLGRRALETGQWNMWRTSS